MSYVIAAPEMMTSAAADLVTIGSELSAAHTAAAGPTVALVPAAADEVSAGVAHLFSRYAEDFHGLAGKAAASQAQFVQNLKASAVSYSSVENAIASLLQPLNVSAASFGSTPVSTSNLLQIIGLWGVSELDKFGNSPFVASLPLVVRQVLFFIIIIPWAIFYSWSGLPPPPSPFL